MTRNSQYAHTDQFFNLKKKNCVAYSIALERQFILCFRGEGDALAASVQFPILFSSFKFHSPHQSSLIECHPFRKDMTIINFK